MCRREGTEGGNKKEGGEGGRERGAWGLLRVIIIGLAVGDGGVLLLGGKRTGLGRGGLWGTCGGQ